MPSSCARRSVSATASTSSCFSFGNARLVGAGALREVEELVAMIEREDEQLVARRRAAR